jgi:PAS domain-containing protein
MSILQAQNKFSMESLDSLFEHATEGIIVANKEGRIIKANPSSERLFGYEKGELLNRVIEELVPTRYKDNHVKDRSKYNENPHARAMGKNKELFASYIIFNVKEVLVKLRIYQHLKKIQKRFTCKIFSFIVYFMFRHKRQFINTKKGYSNF